MLAVLTNDTRREVVCVPDRSLVSQAACSHTLSSAAFAGPTPVWASLSSTLGVTLISGIPRPHGFT